MKWRIACKSSEQEFEMEGTLDEAVWAAVDRSTDRAMTWVVWLLQANLRMAEVTNRGASWLKSDLTGEEVRRLMRCHMKTIAGLSFATGITQRRIREVRELGLRDRYAIRDWLEAISGTDVGPLPERYRIRRHAEECSCDYCGCPLYVGDVAYSYVNSPFCSITCSRKSRGFGVRLELAE
jgi:hypothetical protein